MAVSSHGFRRPSVGSLIGHRNTWFCRLIAVCRRTRHEIREQDAPGRRHDQIPVAILPELERRHLEPPLRARPDPEPIPAIRPAHHDPGDQSLDAQLGVEILAEPDRAEIFERIARRCGAGNDRVRPHVISRTVASSFRSHGFVPRMKAARPPSVILPSMAGSLNSGAGLAGIVIQPRRARISTTCATRRRRNETGLGRRADR